ncbi:protein turtle homolog B-like [Haliotis rubra]|uniref:protein turtle homolog B-like n=1 Tax=Haliotis rubra TaxID=36100 RepID=UPI001EE632D3|nr:protein turtle homolog B-like [Haliotis rubra]
MGDVHVHRYSTSVLRYPVRQDNNTLDTSKSQLISLRWQTTGMVKIFSAAIFCVAAGVVSGAPSASPVLSAVSDTARFSWEIPQGGLGTGSSFFALSPAGVAVFTMTASGIFLGFGNYGDRLEYRGNITARNVTFTLSNIQTSDAGTYTCGAGGSAIVIQNCGQKLIVLGKPTTPGRPPVSTTPVYNQPVTLTCSSNSTTVPADHGLTLTYTWQRDNTDISVTSPGSPYTFTVSSRDSHNYRCRARESRGLESEWSQVYNMEPQYGPYQISLTPSTSSYNVTEHQALPSITCSALCRPGCSYRWLHNGTVFSSEAVLQGQADRSKSGSYRCQPSNTHGSSDSVTVSFDVQYPADISIFNGNSHSGSVTVNESYSVTLRCQIDSNPRSVIRLLNGTEELTRADNSLTATYRLESADCRQRGNYSCTATNNIGAPVTRRVELLVQCSPRLDDSKQLKFATTLGGDVTVSVSVLAYPPPTFTWSRVISISQDLTGSSSPASDISITASVHLTNLQQQDFGDYSLTVGNGVGSPVTYTVSVVPVGPPQTPTQFRDLDNATTSSVWLSWLPGFNGGHPQMFPIEYRQFATRTWTVYKSYDDTGEMMVVEVTGLISGGIYIIRLHAKNHYGNSDGYVLVESVTAGDPPDQQKLEASCISTGVLAGATVGTFLLTLLIGGTVLIVLYRKGYRVTNILKGAAQKRHPEPVDMDNRGYSSLDHITVPAQYSNVEEESEKQQYTQLKIYENTKAEAAADTSTYEGVTEAPPVTYESISASPYQNTGAHPPGPHE